MARKPLTLLKKKIKKTIKPTKSEDYLINYQHLGEEPDFNGKTVSRVDYIKTTSWYNYMCNVKEARSYMATYLNAVGRSHAASSLSGVSDTRFPSEAAWVARMLSNGAVLPDSSKLFMEAQIDQSITLKNKKDAFKDASDDVQEVKKITVQDRVREKASDLIGAFDEEIDLKGYDFSPYAWLQEKEVTPIIASKIAEFFKPIAEESSELLKKNVDDQLKEGYGGFTKEQLKVRAAFYNSILTDCERFSNNTKKTRTPRKPKVISVEKKVIHIKPLKESNEFKVASINPNKIIGAAELWTFNTKYKTMTLFVALDRGGLDVNRTAITKFNPEKSFTFRTGRKTEEYVAIILNGGKIAVRKMMDGLKKSDIMQERINENTILMKVLN